MASTTELAWAAGLYEGEGSASITQGKPRLALGSTDFDILHRFHAIVGVGAVGKPYLRVGVKPMRYWQCTNSPGVARVLTLLMPWLGERRRERAERVRDVALLTVFRKISRAAQRTDDGDYLVPAEAFVQLLAAIGRGE